MKAHQLIVSASYGPEQLKALGKAFDDAWEQVAPRVGNSNSADAVEAARLKLANIILGLATTGNLDPEQLTGNAVQLMTDAMES